MKGYWTKPLTRTDLLKDGLLAWALGIVLLFLAILIPSLRKTFAKEKAEKTEIRKNFRKYTVIRRKEEENEED